MDHLDPLEETRKRWRKGDKVSQIYLSQLYDIEDSNPAVTPLLAKLLSGIGVEMSEFLFVVNSGPAAKNIAKEPITLQPFLCKTIAELCNVQEYGRSLSTHLTQLPKSSLPDYFGTMAEYPMTLGMVSKKCKSGNYSNVEKFEEEVEMVFANAEAYNGGSRKLIRDARKLRVVFAQMMTNTPIHLLIQDNESTSTPDLALRHDYGTRSGGKRVKKFTEFTDVDGADWEEC